MKRAIKIAISLLIVTALLLVWWGYSFISEGKRAVVAEVTDYEFFLASLEEEVRPRDLDIEFRGLKIVPSMNSDHETILCGEFSFGEKFYLFLTFRNHSSNSMLSDGSWRNQLAAFRSDPKLEEQISKSLGDEFHRAREHGKASDRESYAKSRAYVLDACAHDLRI